MGNGSQALSSQVGPGQNISSSKWDRHVISMEGWATHRFGDKSAVLGVHGVAQAWQPFHFAFVWMGLAGGDLEAGLVCSKDCLSLRT